MAWQCSGIHINYNQLCDSSFSKLIHISSSPSASTCSTTTIASVSTNHNSSVITSCTKRDVTANHTSSVMTSFKKPLFTEKLAAPLKEDIINNNISIHDIGNTDQIITIGANHVVSSSSSLPTVLPSMNSKLDGIVEILSSKSSKKSCLSAAKVKFHPKLTLPAISESSNVVISKSSSSSSLNKVCFFCRIRRW